MNPIPLDLPPGVWKNGTRYQSRNRFFETNRVRWLDGSLRPIGGWTQREFQGTPYAAIVSDPLTETVRDQLAWRDAGRSPVLVAGTAANVYWIKSDGTYEAITPAGLTPGADNPTNFNGYGTGPYGLGAYGTARQGDNLLPTPVARWRLQVWGEDLLALPDWIQTGPESRIHSWDGASGNDLTPIANCPTGFFDFTVTKNRFVMGIGDDVEARLVTWSDQENFNLWAPAVTNQAGSIVLGGDGNLISIHNVADQVLILTETDAHVGRYIGPPYVFGFDMIGEKCRPVDKNLVAVADDFAVWFGRQKVWQFDGAKAFEIECPLFDLFRDTAAISQISKSFTWINDRYNEIWWHYVSNESENGQPDCYIKWQWKADIWDYGKLDRSSLIGAEILPDPHGVSHDALPYWHELPGILPPDTFAVTGPLEIGDGEQNMLISRLFPDVQLPDSERTWDQIETELNLGRNVGISPGEMGATVQFMSRMHSQGDVKLSPLYALRNPTPTRVRGKEIMMRISGTVPKWEFGRWRMDVKPIGKGGR